MGSFDSIKVAEDDVAGGLGRDARSVRRADNRMKLRFSEWGAQQPILLPTWDRLALTLGLPTSECRTEHMETLFPVAFPESGQTLTEIAEGVADRAAVILRAMPEAYRLAGVVGTP